MAEFQIVAIRTERSADETHEHIVAVKLRWGHELSRSTVIQDIRYGTDTYFTEADGKRADVIVVGCPQCSFRDYIRTERDSTTADNLLSLPRF